MSCYIHKGKQKLVGSQFSNKTFWQLALSLLGTTVSGLPMGASKGRL